MEENKLVKSLFYCGIFIAILALCWFLLSEPVHDIRGKSDDIRTELGNAGNAQRDAESHIKNAGERIDRSTELADEVSRGIDEASERIEDSAKRNGECAELIADSERRIAESRTILQGIREGTRQKGK